MRWTVCAALVVCVCAGSAFADGFDRAGVSLADNTSISLKTNASYADIAKWASEEGFSLPEEVANFPGVTASYFDEKLVTISPVDEDAVVDLPKLGECPAVAAIVLYPKPDGFERRWPLYQKAAAGAWLMVAVAQGGKEGLLLVRKAGAGPKPMSREAVSAVPGFEIARLRVRKVERGSVPGAIIGVASSFPYVTQMGRGCALGVGYMTEKTALCADLVRMDPAPSP